MSEPNRERIVVSVGGSLIVPDRIDTDFLSRFRALISEKVGQGFSFYIITGGGKTARRYQDAAIAVHGDLTRDDLDWLGIHSTRLNGHLLRTIFREEAHPELIKDPSQAVESAEPVIVGAGWKPGWSTDYCAVEAAKSLGAKRVVNLSNIDYVYDKDPRKFEDAQKIERITWPEFRKLIPSEWDPGLSSPFDPVAAREAEALHLEVAIMSGAHLDRFSAYLDGKPFIGTVIV
jgi:uridylate kinase